MLRVAISLEVIALAMSFGFGGVGPGMAMLVITAVLFTVALRLTCRQGKLAGGRRRQPFGMDSAPALHAPIYLATAPASPNRLGPWTSQATSQRRWSFNSPE